MVSTILVTISPTEASVNAFQRSVANVTYVYTSPETAALTLTSAQYTAIQTDDASYFTISAAASSAGRYGNVATKYTFDLTQYQSGGNSIQTISILWDGYGTIADTVNNYWEWQIQHKSGSSVWVTDKSTLPWSDEAGIFCSIAFPASSLLMGSSICFGLYAWEQKQVTSANMRVYTDYVAIIVQYTSTGEPPPTPVSATLLAKYSTPRVYNKTSLTMKYNDRIKETSIEPMYANFEKWVTSTLWVNSENTVVFTFLKSGSSLWLNTIGDGSFVYGNINTEGKWWYFQKSNLDQIKGSTLQLYIRKGMPTGTTVAVRGSLWWTGAGYLSFDKTLTSDAYAWYDVALGTALDGDTTVVNSTSLHLGIWVNGSDYGYIDAARIILSGAARASKSLPTMGAAFVEEEYWKIGKLLNTVTLTERIHTYPLMLPAYKYENTSLPDPTTIPSTLWTEWTEAEYATDTLATYQSINCTIPGSFSYDKWKFFVCQSDAIPNQIVLESLAYKSGTGTVTLVYILSGTSVTWGTLTNSPAYYYVTVNPSDLGLVADPNYGLRVFMKAQNGDSGTTTAYAGHLLGTVTWSNSIAIFSASFSTAIESGVLTAWDDSLMLSTSIQAFGTSSFPYSCLRADTFQTNIAMTFSFEKTTFSFSDKPFSTSFNLKGSTSSLTFGTVDTNKSVRFYWVGWSPVDWTPGVEGHTPVLMLRVVYSGAEPTIKEFWQIGSIATPTWKEWTSGSTLMMGGPLSLQQPNDFFETVTVSRVSQGTPFYGVRRIAEWLLHV